MTTSLHTLQNNPGSTQNKTRKGRGIGSGKGKTCGRGHKGQKSRSGVAIKGFEGGQMPIHRRLPKRGFNNYNRKTIVNINVSDIEGFVASKKLDAKKAITVDVLRDAGIIKGQFDGVKLLAKGEIKTAVTVQLQAASEAAVKAVEKAGGKVEIVALPVQAANAEAEKKPAAKKAAAKKPAAKKATKATAKKAE